MYASFGEKTSLQDVLQPIASAYGSDLYLPSGEISDTLIHKMAKTGADDGREMIVIILADCDPAGYQMSVSIGHKLRAMREFLFPALRGRTGERPRLAFHPLEGDGTPSCRLAQPIWRGADRD